MTIRTVAGRVARRTPVVRGVARRASRLLRSTPQATTDALADRVSAVNHLSQYTHDEAIVMRARLEAIETHLPSLLNAVASSAGMMRRLSRQEITIGEDVERLRGDFRRLAGATGLGGQVMTLTNVVLGTAQKSDVDSLAARVEGLASSSSALADHADRTKTEMLAAIAAVRSTGDDTHQRLAALEQQVIGHAQTQSWLIQRVETIRAEMMHELRYGHTAEGAGTPAIETRVVDKDKVAAAVESGTVRLNLGCGHVALAGYVNCDMRELPGVDVVAPAEGLPFESGSVQEIMSAHFLEHFAEEDLRRRLLPIWSGLLAPGGTFRAIVPDFEAMTQAWGAGEIGFEVLRSVLFGGQEYEGDFHFTMFTPDSLKFLLNGVGLAEFEVIERSRRNGDCLEMEITARKPAKA